MYDVKFHMKDNVPCYWTKTKTKTDITNVINYSNRMDSNIYRLTYLLMWPEILNVGFFDKLIMTI